MNTGGTYYILLFLLLLAAFKVAAQDKDSSALLKKVTVTSLKKKNTFTTITPSQSLSRESLQQINAPSAGDAARFFSGVLVKDYGGVGGLKTVSVRSLGASHTAVTYDGIPVSDAQSGQIDLSRYSTTFLQSLDLYQANMQGTLLPARTYASGAVLSLYTQAFYPVNLDKKGWQAGIRSGSFGLWNPFGGVSLPLSKKTVAGFNAEALTSKGDYPFYIENGRYSTKAKRQNSLTKSLQGELNALTVFPDSSALQVKLWGYASARGLPGAIVFFNDRSVQKLWNTDAFAQARYQKKINDATSVLASAKYAHNYTRYTDPDYLNNAGGLDNRYRQEEWYLSFAANRDIFKNLILSGASDIAVTSLSANLNNFAHPSRISVWNNIGLRYAGSLWQLNGSLLYTHISDRIKTGTAAADKNELNPTIAMSVRPSEGSPLMFRIFYKSIFRMPTFNDLYYNFTGNAALRPEYARQYNAGIVISKQLTRGFKQFSISADAYYNEVRDKIIAIPNKNLFVWTMLNLGEVRIKGVDVAAEAGGKLFQSVGWFARTAYTWQQALDVTHPSAASYKDRIPYTPDQSGCGLLTFHYRDWSTGYSILFSGTRFTLGENNPYNHLRGWETHDAFVSRLLKMKSFTLNIKAELNNLSGQRYDIVRYFPMPGRSFKINLLFSNF